MYFQNVTYYRIPGDHPIGETTYTGNDWERLRTLSPGRSAPVGGEGSRRDRRLSMAYRAPQRRPKVGRFQVDKTGS